MSLFWNSKKKDDSSQQQGKPPTPTSASAQFEPASVGAKHDSNAAGGGGGDLFGGMAVVRRKKKGQVEEFPAPAQPEPAAPPAPSPATAPAPAAEPTPTSAVERPAAPFFAKFELNKGGIGELGSDDEDPETARIRRRLERFYEEYNPSKLSQVDQTLKTYAGREAELFDALIAKYGPEPQTPVKQPKGKPAAAAAPSSSAAPVQVQAEAPATSSAFGFVAPSADATNSGGFGGGWGESSDAPASGFAFGDGSAGAGGGFTFGANETSSAASGGFGFATEAAGETSGFAFAAGNVAVAGFETDAGPSASAGFGFVAETSAAPQAAATSAPPAAASPEKADNDDDDDDDDEEMTMNERHNKLLRDAQGDVLLSRRSLADGIQGIAEAIKTRRRSIDSYGAVEAKIEDCIAREDFALADQLTAELDTIAQEIATHTRQHSEAAARLPQLKKALQHDVQTLAELYTTQRIELLESRGEDERAANKFIAENTSRLELAGEKVRAALDRATRALHNSSQEVVNLEQRRQKVVDKVSEQTKGLRGQRDEVAAQKDALETEISELEAKLAAKRRALASTKVELHSLNEKLAVITADHAETIGEVERQLDEERTRQSRHQADVDQLAHQQESVMNEEIALREEKARLAQQLAQNNDKIERYAGYAKVLKANVVNEIDDFTAQTTASLLAKRQLGISILAPVPVGAVASLAGSSGEEESAGSPLSELNRVKNQLLQATQGVQKSRADESVIVLRQQEIAKNLPLLDAAKKSFAAAKQFKEAQAKSEEIKKLQEEAAHLTAQIAQVHEAVSAGEITVKELEKKLAVESSSAARKIESFVQEYRSVLQEVQARVERAPNVLQLSENELGYQPDDLQEAARDLIATALEEFNKAMIACGQKPLDTSSANSKTTAANPDTDASAVENEDDEVEEKVESAEESPESPSAAQATRSEDELRAELDELNLEMERAIEQEDYAQCDALQLKIDEVNALLSQ